MNLDYIININNFQKIQDAISEAADMAILTVDYKGIPVTKHSRCSDFCKKVRENPDYIELCEKCDSRGGLEAVRLQQPYIYLCHMGLLDFAIPIIADGHYLGAVMGGQVQIKEEYEKEKLEQIVNSKFHITDMNMKNELEGLYKKLPIMTFNKVRSVADVIFQISNYIVEEAILKIKLNEMNQKILTLSELRGISVGEEKLDSALVKGESDENNLISSDTNKGNIENNLEIVEEKKATQLYRDNMILRPALEYIQSNYNKAINLDDMASLCNISTSYFSKLFKKAINDNFSNYINKFRIKRAKELLEDSDMPIINIALDLGFEDCGYFIKVFKKIEGVTPAVYRENFDLNIMKYY